MDQSRLDEMPPGRQPIETRVIAEDRLGDVVEALGRHIATDGQAYWVYPLVEERSEEHTSELQSLMRISYAVFCLKKKKKNKHKGDLSVNVSCRTPGHIGRTQLLNHNTT